MFILFCLELSSPTTKRSPTIFSWCFTSVTKVTWTLKCHVFKSKRFKAQKSPKPTPGDRCLRKKLIKSANMIGINMDQHVLLSLWDELESCNCHNVSSWPWRRIYMDHPLWSLQVLGLTTWPHSDTMKPSTAFHIRNSTLYFPSYFIHRPQAGQD